MHHNLPPGNRLEGVVLASGQRHTSSDGVPHMKNVAQSPHVIGRPKSVAVAPAPVGCDKVPRSSFPISSSPFRPAFRPISLMAILKFPAV
jgi:hypothetical protein